MLPTMQNFSGARTAQVIRIGYLQLYFSYSQLIGFQIDGQQVVVCANNHGRLTTEKHLLLLEADKSKWISDLEFSQQWLETSNRLFSY